MKLLLDTHTFIWWDSEPDKLSPKALELCEDSANVLLLSVASVCEIQIKHQIGKLSLREPLTDILQGQQERNALQIVPISLAHVLALEAIALHHRDPFDRLLIAQANVEGVAIVSGDPLFAHYAVRVLW